MTSDPAWPDWARERQARIDAETAAEQGQKELFGCRQEAQFLESLAAACASGTVAETLPFALEQLCALAVELTNA